MLFMNRWDIDNAVAHHRHNPVLGPASKFLAAFRDEVDANSDGWAYWIPPVKSAKKLMELIQKGELNEKVTLADLRKAITPIKAFYTRRGYKAGMQFPTNLGTEVL